MKTTYDGYLWAPANATFSSFGQIQNGDVNEKENRKLISCDKMATIRSVRRSR